MCDQPNGEVWASRWSGTATPIDLRYTTARSMGKQHAHILCCHPVAPDMAALHGPVSPTPHPAGDGSPDLVRRIFLDEMNPRHRLLGQQWPPPDEVDQRIIGEDRTWLSLQEQLAGP